MKSKPTSNTHFHTINCDNPICNYTMEIKEMEPVKMIGKPCPDCGWNLLTQEDYDKTMALIDVYTKLNDLPEHLLSKLTGGLTEEEVIKKLKADPIFNDIEGIDLLEPNTKEIVMTVNVHKSINIESITPAEEKDEK